jgi:serine/threonine protein kinase
LNDDDYIYEGIYVELDKPVVVKVMEKTDLNDDQVQREKEALNRNDNHKNIVKLWTIKEDENYYYIAYDKCWNTLENYINDNTEETSNFKISVKSILRGASEGLQSIHNFDQHRNIRPGNIQICYESGENTFYGKISNLLLSKNLTRGKYGKVTVSREFPGDVR